MHTKSYVLIGGAGKNSELSTALINILLKNNYQVGIITRSDFSKEFWSPDQVELFSGDLLDDHFIRKTIQSIVEKNQSIKAYIHNAGALFKVPFLEARVDTFQDALNRNFLSAIPITQALIQDALQKNYEQHLIFLGATSSTKGSANFSPFAAAKFALRGFAQSIAREFGAQGIHSCHVVIDGVIKGKRAEEVFNKPSVECIDGHEFAEMLLYLIQQSKSTWTQEIDVRPISTKF